MTQVDFQSVRSRRPTRHRLRRPRSSTEGLILFILGEDDDTTPIAERLDFLGHIRPRVRPRPRYRARAIVVLPVILTEPEITDDEMIAVNARVDILFALTQPSTKAEYFAGIRP